MKKLVLVAAVSLFSLAAQAQVKSYVEVGYTQLKATSGSLKATPGVLRGMFGYELNPNMGFEAMVAFGVNDAVVQVGDQNTVATATIENAFGLYLKPKAKLTPSLEVFGRLGYANSKGSGTINGLSASDTDGSFSYGAGFNYAVSPGASLNVDYMQYY